MAWIKAEQSLLTHRKTFTLADKLDLPELYAASHVIALWMWALDNAPDGVIRGTDRQIAKAAQWPGPATQFVDALVFAGFLDDDFDGKREIHDWHEYAGALIAKRRTNAARQQKWRANHPKRP